MTLPFVIAQLRHLYQQMLDGQVKDTAEAARGLLGPAIARLELVAPVVEAARNWAAREGDDVDQQLATIAALDAMRDGLRRMGGS